MITDQGPRRVVLDCNGCRKADLLAHQLVGAIMSRPGPGYPVGGTAYSIARECWELTRDRSRHNHPIP